MRELIDNIVADSSPEDTSRLARIRSELPKLSEEPDPTILEQIRLRFPGLPSTAWGSVKAHTERLCRRKAKNVACPERV